jgi:hypothetical protein
MSAIAFSGYATVAIQLLVEVLSKTVRTEVQMIKDANP